MTRRELTPADYIAMLRRRWVLITVVALIGSPLAYGVSRFLPAKYKSQTLVLVERPTVSPEIIPQDRQHQYRRAAGEHEAADSEPDTSRADHSAVWPLSTGRQSSLDGRSRGAAAEGDRRDSRGADGGDAVEQPAGLLRQRNDGLIREWHSKFARRSRRCLSMRICALRKQHSQVTTEFLVAATRPGEKESRRSGRQPCRLQEPVHRFSA